MSQQKNPLKHVDLLDHKGIDYDIVSILEWSAVLYQMMVVFCAILQSIYRENKGSGKDGRSKIN